jgi:hypothetical protein
MIKKGDTAGSQSSKLNAHEVGLLGSSGLHGAFWSFSSQLMRLGFSAKDPLASYHLTCPLPVRFGPFGSVTAR